ncbi:dynamin family protein [Aspergillus vadensis CBS 113365]|uniref:Interferon-induced GTP-binding protein Mx2 n=1 Tax=Aspergillus vadensis (strain CBS 113365 / IMI 142717 / IBT 24658) TaxID=1448311 RepID=A0A319B918_ASPVC|nr:interferon-induced GTP-binding protein Mx2 [Aspergillus vadensis CBS 113365]PYH68859.1 interferon-induced GTP-binding protein Mx2 [Aspergillus vadensis CBS 113365]
MAIEEDESSPKHLNSSELLKKIDKLREKNIGKHVPLPQLVVVGDQSSGKSSLLASLTKIPFPRDLELCTRYATQITSRREDDRSVAISIIPAGDASLEHRAKVQGFKRTLTGTDDFRSEFPAILKEVDECMGIRTDLSSNEGSVFSKDVLRIELCGPEEDYLTNYIKDARTVILAVLPSNVDLATQEILKLAKDYDVNGERTLGVLTKPDLVIEQSAKAALCSLVMEHKRPLTLGYYLVRNQGADQDASFSGEEGERMFDSQPWNTLPRDRIGIQALRERLGELLSEVTEREFPELRKDIKNQIDSCHQDLVRLGPARQTEQEQRAFLSGIARQFQSLARAARDAHYTENEAFAESDLRLLTHIVNLSDKFSSTFQAKAHLLPFDCPTSDAVDKRQPYNDMNNNPHGKGHLKNCPRGKADMHAQMAAGDRFSLAQNVNESREGLDPNNFPELEQIVSRVEGPQDPEGDIKAWIGKLYAKSRGLDLGTFGNNILCNAFKEQTGKWEAMTCGHLYHKIWSSILDDLLQRYKNAMSQAMFLLSVERNRRPYTLNNYFNHSLQKLRSARVAQALEDNARYTNDNWSNAEMKVVDLDAVKKSASDQGNVEHITGEIHDILWSYYQVARERFVDNVHMQAIEHCLLTGPESPLEVFSQEWVINLGSDELGAIAGEPQAIKARRTNLKQKMEDLKSALQTLKF